MCATFLVWFGPTVRLTVSDPDLIREIFTSKSEFYEKNEAPPLVKQLEGDGLLSLKGEKWAHHRRIISPTFHMENLKLLIPVMATSVVEMLEKWSAMGEKGEVEIEVSEWFQRLTEDVITRTAFGSSYEDGKAIFRLQGQQMDLAADAFQKICAHKEEHKVVEVGEGDKEIAGETDRATEGEFGEGGGEGSEGFVGAND
ncbi:hypothetical protein V8G54_016671 [Vigna mungo]|uniref:Cytochrome P450 n=1 Tax=Vigna mungo TaxID=3915 RepID=A0AAQ3NNI6_VIGMU